MSREGKSLLNTFLNGLDDEFSALVKKKKMNWATMSTHDLVNLGSQLSKTIEKYNKREINQALTYPIKAAQVMSLQ